MKCKIDSKKQNLSHMYENTEGNYILIFTTSRLCVYLRTTNPWRIARRKALTL